MKVTKQEMEVLKRFDTCQCSVGKHILSLSVCSLCFGSDEYASQLEILLNKKLASISDLRNRLRNFQEKLKKEEELSATVRG